MCSSYSLANNVSGSPCGAVSVLFCRIHFTSHGIHHGQSLPHLLGNKPVGMNLSCVQYVETLDMGLASSLAKLHRRLDNLCAFLFNTLRCHQPPNDASEHEHSEHDWFNHHVYPLHSEHSLLMWCRYSPFSRSSSSPEPQLRPRPPPPPHPPPPPLTPPSEPFYWKPATMKQDWRLKWRESCDARKGGLGRDEREQHWQMKRCMGTERVR